MNPKHCLPMMLLVLAGSATALDQTPTVTARTILKETTSWDGRPIQYPVGPAQVTGMVIEIAPGAETGWHLHPVPSFAMVLDGELQVRLKDGRTKTLRAGEGLAEVVDTFHNGRNMGTGPVRLVVFYIGTVDQSLTKKETTSP